DSHIATGNIAMLTGTGAVTNLITGAMDNQTISYIGHKPLCSGNLEQSNVGGNYQACVLPYASGSYMQGFSWNMTYDRVNNQYPCLGDGTLNGCSALLGNNAGSINFLAVS